MEVWGLGYTCQSALGQCFNPVFRLILQSKRDRYMLLERRYKKMRNEQEKASGISPDPSEIDQLMEEIVTLFDQAEKAEIAKKLNMEEEAKQFQGMRKTSLETFRESRERNKDGQHNAKKKRSNQWICFNNLSQGQSGNGVVTQE